MRVRLFYDTALLYIDRSTLSLVSHNFFIHPVSGDVQFFAVSPSTMGNVTVADNLKLMEVDGNFLLVGAT